MKIFREYRDSESNLFDEEEEEDEDEGEEDDYGNKHGEQEAIESADEQNYDEEFEISGRKI